MCLTTLWVWAWPPRLDTLVYMETFHTVTFPLYLALGNLKYFSFRTHCDQLKEAILQLLYIFPMHIMLEEAVAKAIIHNHCVIRKHLSFGFSASFWMLCPHKSFSQSALCKQSGFSLNYLEYFEVPAGKLCCLYRQYLQTQRLSLWFLTEGKCGDKASLQKINAFLFHLNRFRFKREWMNEVAL